MPFEIEAVYEGGVLKPARPLPLAGHDAGFDGLPGITRFAPG